MLRELDVALLRDRVAHLLVESNYAILPDILDALREAASREKSELGRRTLEQLVHNYEIAAAERVPVCQDSGLAVVMLQLGQDVHWVGGSMEQAVHDGIREGTTAGYLRRSVTSDPTRRLEMSGDGAAGVIHTEIVPGNGVRVTVASKGFGAENMSALRMFVPADGIPAIREFVVETVDRAGANACPPIVVGVGVGGTFEMAALLAKQAVLRTLTWRQERQDLPRRAAREADRRRVRRGLRRSGARGAVRPRAAGVSSGCDHRPSGPQLSRRGTASVLAVTDPPSRQ